MKNYGSEEYRKLRQELFDLRYEMALHKRNEELVKKNEEQIKIIKSRMAKIGAAKFQEERKGKSK